MKSEKREKKKEKWKNENTRLRRWWGENITALSYSRFYCNGSTAVWKCCFESRHLAWNFTRLLLHLCVFMVTCSGYLRNWCCLSEKASPQTTCNPPWMLSDEYINQVFGLFRITLATNSKIRAPPRKVPPYLSRWMEDKKTQCGGAHFRLYEDNFCSWPHEHAWKLQCET